jgi:WD40 repeat protein
VSDGEVLATIRDTGPIHTLAFSPDGKLLAVGGDAVRVWDIDRQAFAGPGWRHPQPLTALVFGRAGDRLITTCRDNRARVFAVAGPQAGSEPLFAPVPHVLPSPPALVDDDRVLVTVTADAELTRWAMATGRPAGKPTRTRPRHLEEIAASPDGKWLAASGVDGPEIHSADAAQSPVHLGHTNRVRKSVFSPDGTMLLSASWDSTARLWSVPTGQPLGHPLMHTAFLAQCAWSHDARHVATAQSDGLVRVWQRPVDALVIAKETVWGECPRVSFDGRLAIPGLWHESPNGGPNATGRRVRVVATASGQPAGPDVSLPGPAADACVCADNRAVAAAWAAGKEGRLGVWEVATARARFEPIPLPSPPVSVAARPGSQQLAVLCSTGDILVLDDQTGAGVLRLRHDEWAASATGRSDRVLYTPDGKALISLTARSIDVRDADSDELQFAPLRPSIERSWFHSLSVSADSRLLATTALVKNHVQVWDLATGRAVSEPLPHPGDFWGLFSVRFSPDARHLLTAHKDGQVRYWDWQAGKLACPAMPFDNDVMDAAITPDGRFALTAVRGRPEMQIWELATGRRAAPAVRFAPQDGGSSLRLAVTPDGRRALVSYWGSSTTTGNFRLAVVDLEALLTPSRLPTNDLQLLAELIMARRIELGDLSGLTVDQWLERWDQLHERSPDLVRTGVVRPRLIGK